MRKRRYFRKKLSRLKLFHLLLIAQTAILFLQFLLINVGTTYAVRWEFQRISFLVLESRAVLFQGLVNRDGYTGESVPGELIHTLNQTCKDTFTRLTIIDRSGEVVFDSHGDSRAMGNHGDRPEFAEALGGRLGQSYRYSDSLRMRMFYSAQPIVNENGIVGALRVSFAEDEARRSEIRIVSVLGLMSLIILAVMLLIITLASKKISGMVKQMELTALKIADGDYNAELPLPLYRESAHLQEALTIMSARIQDQQEELRRQTMEDSLTGLGNRRYFEETLDLHWKLKSRNKSSLSLIMLDIDKFKSYNDTLGHPAGDRCLRETAALLKKATVRTSDILTRYGGEEFAVLLPDTDLKGAIHVAKRIHECFNGEKLPHPASEVAPFLTVSMGLNTADFSGEGSRDSLVNGADQALYRAKEKGRNCFEAYIDERDNMSS